jgi:outer membrane lipoprotein carrier protein
MFRCGFLFAALFLIPALVQAQDPEPRDVARKLQSTYEKAANMVADFRQTSTMKFSSRVQKGSGTMIFRKPGQMRWDYEAPDEQLFLSDGKTFSMYFARNKQMIVSSAREYLQSDVTYSFFAGTGDILQDFTANSPDIANSEDNSFLIKLTPKASHPHVAAMYAWVTKNSFLLTHLQIIDHFETVTDLYFDNIQVNAAAYGNRPIEDRLFIFSPPAGTEIIDQF